MYYFEVYHREVILDYKVKLEWSGPGVSSGYITSESLTYEVDQYLPKKPENFSLITTGVNDVVIEWDPSIDDETEVRGYNSYVDGTPVMNNPNEELIYTNSYWLKELSPNTNYNITVTAFDAGLNESSEIILLSTSTGGFCATCNQDNVKKGQYTASIDNFLDNSPMIMIEFGCEVWGSRSDGNVNHGSPFSGEEEYGEWARMMGKHIKNSPYYDPEKVLTVYSGRHMNRLTWNNEVYGNDTGTVDYLAVSGYNGGNLNYDVDVPNVDKPQPKM